ncbi:hypothetical protein AWQ21_02675 [Picosynechococcus sp. PCC 7003]|nr:hypothetical protein AWQ21_02675 [Picosynechococcus sp. PCC 7003]
MLLLSKRIRERFLAVAGEIYGPLQPYLMGLPPILSGKFLWMCTVAMMATAARGSVPLVLPGGEGVTVGVVARHLDGLARQNLAPSCVTLMRVRLRLRSDKIEIASLVDAP